MYIDIQPSGSKATIFRQELHSLHFEGNGELRLIGGTQAPSMAP